jgi:hypothetical protein
MTMLTVRVDATAVRAVPLARAAEVAAPAVGRDVRDGFRPAGATTRLAVRACSLDAVPAAVMRAPMGRDRISGWLCGAYRSVRARLAVEGIAMAGPAFACYTDTGDGIEVEAGYWRTVSLIELISFHSQRSTGRERIVRSEGPGAAGHRCTTPAGTRGCGRSAPGNPRGA